MICAGSTWFLVHRFIVSKVLKILVSKASGRSPSSSTGIPDSADIRSRVIVLKASRSLPLTSRTLFLVSTTPPSCGMMAPIPTSSRLMAALGSKLTASVKSRRALDIALANPIAPEPPRRNASSRLALLAPFVATRSLRAFWFALFLQKEVWASARNKSRSFSGSSCAFCAARYDSGDLPHSRAIAAVWAF